MRTWWVLWYGNVFDGVTRNPETVRRAREDPRRTVREITVDHGSSPTLREIMDAAPRPTPEESPTDDD